MDLAGVFMAFTPLIDPLFALYPGMSAYWLWLVIPLVVAISIIYKGTRIPDLRKLPAQVAIMSFQILFLMVLAAVALDALYYVWVRAR